MLLPVISRNLRSGGSTSENTLNKNSSQNLEEYYDILKQKYALHPPTCFCHFITDSATFHGKCAKNVTNRTDCRS
jgi:hypothetical protein